MHTANKNGILKRLFSFLMALTFIAGVIQLDPIKMKRTLAAEDYHTWRQMDPRWGSISMNGTTVASSGCLITSLSIMARASDSLDDAALENLGITSIDDFNPGVLAQAYNNRNGFNYGGAIASWGTISQIIPQISFVKDSYLTSYTQADIAAELKSMMDQGYHVILNVNWHWVYIEGVVGNDIYMIDPACDTRLLYDYYTLFGGNEYWLMKCKNPPAPFTPPVSDITTTTTTDVTGEIVTTDTTETTETTAATYQETTTTTTTKSVTQLTSTTTKKSTTDTTATTTTKKSTTKLASTTTTTKSATTTATKTTTASSSSKPVTTTNMPAGEYYNPKAAEIGIYASSDMSGKPIAFVRMTEVVDALECKGTAGHIAGSDGFAGWIDLSGMLPVKDEAARERGDINGDKKIDMIDLGLLSDYLGSLDNMPDGVSIFTGCEKEAADINGDGKVSSGDVLVCLMLVCG